MAATAEKRISLIDALKNECLKNNIRISYTSKMYDGSMTTYVKADITTFILTKSDREYFYTVDWNRDFSSVHSLVVYIIRKTLEWFDEYRKYTKAVGKNPIPTHLEVDLSKHIEKVMFNPPATIVFWDDGTKTVVKADGEDYDPEKGMAMAFSRKLLGDRGSYYNVFEYWLKKWDKEHSTVFKKVLLTNEDVIAPWKDIKIPKLELNLDKLKEFTSTINKPIPDIQQAMYDKLKEGEDDARKHDLVYKAYKKLKEFCHEGKTTDLEEVLGYLGEYLYD